MRKKLFSLFVIITFSSHVTLNLTRPVQDPSNVAKMFALSPQEIEGCAQRAVEQVQVVIDSVAAIPAQQRTFANTILPIDRASNFSDAFVLFQICQVLKDLHPDEAVRTSAVQAIETINAVVSIPIIGPGELTNSRELYQAFCEYMDNGRLHEELNEEQQRYLEDLAINFERAGFGLPEEERQRVVRLNQEINELIIQFSKNNSEKNPVVVATKEELTGVDEKILTSLEQDDKGRYVIPVVGRAFGQVMRDCSVGQTRKRFFMADSNRVYPENDLILRRVVAKRDELAKLLGYESYAQFDLAVQMAKTPERVEQFFAQFTPKALRKCAEESWDYDCNHDYAGDTLRKDLASFRRLWCEGWDVL